jgi:hypothetical protein
MKVILLEQALRLRIRGWVKCDRIGGKQRSPTPAKQTQSPLLLQPQSDRIFSTFNSRKSDRPEKKDMIKTLLS